MIRCLGVLSLATCVALVACDGRSAGVDQTDASSRPGVPGDDGFDETEDPVSTGDAGDGNVSPMDAGNAMDAGKAKDAGRPLDAGKTADAGKRVDAGDAYGDDCEEVFVFDPAGIAGVNDVVLTGDYSRWTSWVPTVSGGAIPMVLGSDGRYSVRVFLEQEVFQYKFVVNGGSAAPQWLADSANCHDANDNFGGRNSIRYACQTVPMCKPPETDAGQLDAGASLDGGDSKDAGVSDGGADAGNTEDAGDAGDARDAGPDMDGSIATDGSVADASVDPDGGEVVDVELGDDCVEVFEVDPARYPDYAPITSVELRGEAPLSYAEAVITLHEDEDGLFRAKARIDRTKFKYNVVLNGKDYARDRDYCPSADDGFGGRGASLRSTCEVPACCENIEIAWKPAESSCADVESASYVGQLATWQKPGKPMIMDEDGTFRITFRDAPGTYEYKIIVGDAYIASPDDNCADNGEAAMTVKACVP